MPVDLHFLLAIAAMAAASYACRVAGYFLMAWVPITDRVQGALKAIPLGVMIGIVLPSAVSGKVPELVGLAVVGVAMKLVGNDVVAALLGAAAVAVCRWAGL
ncbi:MAG: AzlD family protein [Ramlibacter sp.]